MLRHPVRPPPRPGVRQHVARPDAARDRSTLVAHPRAYPRPAAAHAVTRRLVRRRDGAGDRSREWSRCTARCGECSSTARCRAGACGDRRPCDAADSYPEATRRPVSGRTGSVAAPSKADKAGAKIKHSSPTAPRAAVKPGAALAARGRRRRRRLTRQRSPTGRPPPPPRSSLATHSPTPPTTTTPTPAPSTPAAVHSSPIHSYPAEAPVSTAGSGEASPRRSPPSPNQSVLEDAAPQSLAGWATAISPGAGESSQSVSFATVNDSPGLFAVQPTVAPDGSLVYTPAANVNGVSTVSVTAHDDGGTAAGGSDIERASHVHDLDRSGERRAGLHGRPESGRCLRSRSPGDPGLGNRHQSRPGRRVRAGRHVRRRQRQPVRSSPSSRPSRPMGRSPISPSCSRSVPPR